MSKLGYNREQMAELIHKQLANLDAMGRRIQLLEQQNDQLLKFNNKLIRLITDGQAQPKPYPKPARPPRKKIVPDYSALPVENILNSL
jgi:hypothetical protein